MPKIYLYQGSRGRTAPTRSTLYALVDADMYECLNQLKWYVRTVTNCTNTLQYAYRIENKKPIFMHRVVLPPSVGRNKVDHINNNGLDNRRCNLRECTHSENISNRRSCKNSSSMYLGVSKVKGRTTWVAECRKNGVKSSKYCKSEKEAALAYNKMATELHGKFANLNII